MDVQLTKALSCSLGEKAQRTRKQFLERTFRDAHLKVTELLDGFAVQMPGNKKWLKMVYDLVEFERECCSFLSIDLHLEPDFGPITLKLRGPEGVKGVLGDWLQTPIHLGNAK